MQPRDLGFKPNSSGRLGILRTNTNPVGTVANKKTHMSKHTNMAGQTKNRPDS